MILNLLLLTSTVTFAEDAKNSTSTIKIGGNFELSGGIAKFGRMVVNGAQLAFQQANSSGGMLGHQIEFIAMDNTSTTANSVTVMQNLIYDQHVVAILGCVTSTNTLVSVPVGNITKYQ